MKKFLPLLFLILVACGQSKTEKLILDYEQTIGNTKTDLSMKIQELKETGKVTGLDSLNFYRLKMDSLKHVLYPDSKIDTVTSEKMKSDIEHLVSSFTRLYEMDNDISYFRKKMNWMKIENEFNLLDINIERFKIMNDSVLSLKYNCTYTIKNPVLNNAKQTISKTYFLNSDESKILKSE